MIYIRRFALVSVLALALGIAACQKEDVTSVGPLDSSPSISLSKVVPSTPYAISVFAAGFNNPRGLKFGPDGYLYVAEGGLGGSISTRGQCDSVVAPIGPYTGGMTGRISKISRSGSTTVVAEGLPSSQTSPGSGSLVSGVADVEFIGNTLYAVLAGAGCSHGVQGVPNSVIRVRQNGSWSVVADLSEFQKSHPVMNPEAEDFEPDGTWYSMVKVGDDLYAVEPNHGELDRINPRRGSVQRVVDISASQGHIVPTAVAYRENHFYVGNLRTFPIVQGSSSVYKISRGGQVEVWATGFTTILGLEFDRRGRLYVLENTTDNPFPTPGTGRILRLNKSGVRDTIATGLFLPTAMTIGPDGKLYVSNKGFGPPIPGFGEILQIDLHDSGEWAKGDENQD
jgi:glucose/arabinose dehydrogenase